MNDDIINGLAEISLWLSNNGRKDFAETVNAACKRLEEMQWKSIEEDMPGYEEQVLVTMGSPDIFIASMDNTDEEPSVCYEWCDQNGFIMTDNILDVDYWMPLPKPPKRPAMN